MARQPDRVVHHGGAWRYVFRVESRERWYSPLGTPAFVHSMSSGYGAKRRDFAHHYYTYDQIGRAIEAYNVRPRTANVDILLAIGPDPGDAPFPGRDSIGAPNEREQVRIACTPSTALTIRRAKDGEFHYLVGPDPSGRRDTPSEIAARLLGYHGQRRKCFPRSQVEAVWSDVVEAVLGAFDSAWENGTWPSLMAAQAELKILEEAEAAEADQTLQNSYWSLLTREDEPLDPFIPHDEDRLGWLTHEDRRTGITYSRPDRPARAIVEVLPGHSDAAESLQAFSERTRFRDVIAVLGEPGKISDSGRFWWRGTPTELNEQLKSKRISVWTYIQE